MSRKHLRIALSEDDAREFSMRKSLTEKSLGATMTDAAFAAALIRGRLEDQMPEAKITALVSFMQELAKDESVPIDRRVESAELIIAFANGLEVKRK